MSTTLISSGQHCVAQQRCPGCGEPTIQTDTEVLCRECNIVTDGTVIDYGPEWRAYDQAETNGRARAGPPVTVGRHENGLTTRIALESRDGNGRALSTAQRRRARRLRRTNQWYVRTVQGEESLCDGLKQIEKIAADAGLPDAVTRRAQQLFRRAVHADMLRHYDIDRTVAAVTYTACRLQKIMLTVDEIAVLSPVEQRSIERTYRYLCRELEIEVPPQTAEEHIPRICAELELGQLVEHETKDFIDRTRNVMPGAGTYPSTIAAVAVYAVCRQSECHPSITQKEVGEAADVNHSTISDTYASLRNRLK